ncbi:hypothetical protein ACSHWO_03285 [Streptomyces sp. HUAS TT3]|uniref:hypothetical protein n=1 Tax=Streptomyces sp. HUAS TT3 TaxID=3447510 RepID=UPI003F657940
MRQHTPGASRESGLSTPRAAGFAGVAFAVMLGAAIVLVRTALPSGGGGEDLVLDEGEQSALSAAVHLVPFAGIAFLWFMGALRAHTGEAEDRFLATVFLGSGLVFVAALFGATAAAGTVLAEGRPESFGRHFAYTLLTTYAMRMAAVFVFATSAIGRRLGGLPRPLNAFGYLVGLALLVVGASAPWWELVFPVWALVISLYVLVVARRRPRRAPHSNGSA